MIVALSVLLVLIAVVLTAIATTTLWWQMHAWLTPVAFESTGFSAPGGPHLSFSVIVPCRQESMPVMAATVAALMNQDHPDVEVVISVGHDDDEPMTDGLTTPQIAERLAQRWPGRVRVSVNHDSPKNKPRQLNTALRECRNDVVGVIDAESLTQPGLLTHVDQTFGSTGADVVQGAVHLMNFQDSWFALRNCMEYRIWFRSRLHGHALAGFIPLGGTTVFIRRDLLLEVGGWDGDCLAEDCELGVRLSSMGKRTAVGYDSALVTHEETPGSVRQLVKQRTRWALGFMQVLAKGEWRNLPTRRQRVQAWWTLVQQNALAVAGILIPVAVLTAVLGQAPPSVVLLTFLPLVPTLMMLGFEVLILHEWGREMNLRVRLRDYALLVVSMPVYQALLAFAVLRAAVKYVTGDFAWEKTSHSGAHLGPAPHQPRPAVTTGRSNS